MYRDFGRFRVFLGFCFRVHLSRNVRAVTNEND